MAPHTHYSLKSTILTAGAASLVATLASPALALSWDAAILRAKSTVSTLSLTEKAALVTGTGWEADACVGNIAANSKINFPGLCLQDGPAGVRLTENNSVFATSINVASTFNKDLIYKNGVAFGEEFRGKGVNLWLGPVANMLRAPEGGRAWEAQGADPYLTGVSVAQQIKGAQSQGVIATIKHYIGNDQEHGRSTGSSNIDDRTFREFYLRPFRDAVDAGVGAVMCSYNKLNGTFACENPQTLSILKNDLGFKGLVMSDWWAYHEGIDNANAGLDMMMPGSPYCCDSGSSASTTYWGSQLVANVNSGKINASRVDDMAIRVLSAWYKLGQDSGYPSVNFDSHDSSKSKNVSVQANHKQVIRQVGGESSVLLKHNGKILPLAGKTQLKKLAVIGSDAGYGNGPNYFSDRGGVSGTVAIGWGSGTANFPYIVTPEQAITEKANSSGISVDVALDDWDLTKAASVAKGADVALVFVFSDSGEGYITVDGNVGDRNNLTLWGNGDNLIKAVAAVNKNTVVVIHAPGPVDMPWVSNANISAIIYAGLPGQETGNAITDVLFGTVNPSGRLPFTINSDRSKYCCDVIYDDNAIVNYTEGLLVDYRWNDAKGIAPVYWFGHGLSYTSFQYSGISVNCAESQTVKVSVSIANTGSYDGSEVPQLYISFPSGSGEPPKQLRGFEKISLKKGEKKTVQFSLDPLKDLAIWDVVKQNWTVPTGTFVAKVGASAGDIRTQVSFEVQRTSKVKKSTSSVLSFGN